MADTNIKQFRIEIGGIKESLTNLETLEDVLKGVEKQVENINKNGGFSVGTKEQNKALKEQIDLEKANQTIQENSQKSYREKQKVLSALGKVIKSMNADTEEEAKRQKELIQQYQGINQELKDFDAVMGNHQRNVGDYKGALKEATAELKDMKAQMMGFDQHSKEFGELAKRAGEVKDRIGDINEAIKRQASDTKQLDAVIDYAKSATAAFQLYKGAMSAFGMETEEAEKAMQQLLGAMNVVQSLQTLSETLQSTTATGKLFHKMLQMVGLEAKTAAASTTALATAEDAADVATKKVNLSLKATKLALASLGIGLVIMLVSELVEHWEDLVGWFNKTFPALSKMGGLMNTLKATVIGLGKAVVEWLVNPWKTFANVIKKVLAGDFKGAVDEAINGVKNQFVNVGNAFKSGFQSQVEKGLEQITLKTIEETNKQTKQQLAELKIQERNNKTYSKKYIDLQKKDFEERKKLAKGNKEELNKIKLEEMQFFADVEDKKTSAAKTGATERTKAAKDAAKAEKDAAKEAAEEAKRANEARHELSKSILDTDIADLRIQEELEKQRLETYSEGPLEKYNEQLKKLQEVQNKIMDKENSKAVLDLAKSLEDSVKSVKMAKDAWMGFLGELVGLNEKQVTDKINALGLNNADVDIVLKSWQKLLQMQDEIGLQYLQKIRNNQKQSLSIMKSEISDFADDFNREYNKLIERVKDSPLEKPVRNKIFGFIDKEETLKNLELLKTQWDKSYIALDAILNKEELRWEEYLKKVEEIYGKDSSAFKKAQKEKADALNPLREKLLGVGQRAKNPTSTETDYTGDGKAGASTKPQRKLWYGNGETDASGKEYSLIDNLANLFDSLDEMVLAPAMDTFAMYMDFAIEETQQKLEQVEELHDKAMDKVNESADKIKELNDSLKDSSNTNLEVTKQQLADEQLLYAQRLAEEQKLAEQEKGLKNKQAEQEARARKMELGYQMVMAIANTAQGASKALAQWGWPTGPIFAGIMAALGAVQTAIIAKQIGSIKPVKYAEGGVLSGPSHANGGIAVGNTGIEVEGGEAVINKKSTHKYLSLLDAINADGNGGKHTLADKKIRKYANGGTLNFEKADETLRANADTNRIINAIDGIDMQPVVAVTDINRVNARLTKVKSLAGR